MDKGAQYTEFTKKLRSRTGTHIKSAVNVSDLYMMQSECQSQAVAPWIFHPLVIFKTRLISGAETDVCKHLAASVHVPVSFVSLRQACRVVALKVTITELPASKVAPVAALLLLWKGMRFLSHLCLVSSVPGYINH